MAGFGKPDRNLLAIYLIALFFLLLFPVSEPKFRLFGIVSDKWMHFALFGGLAMLMRWNLSKISHTFSVSVGAAFAVAAATELAQSLVAYRSAEWWDLLAGLLGAILGAGIMNRISSSPLPEKLMGLLVIALGFMIGAFSVLADVIGIGGAQLFGPNQVVGTALGALIVAGGIRLYLRGLRGEFRPS